MKKTLTLLLLAGVVSLSACEAIVTDIESADTSTDSSKADSTASAESIESSNEASENGNSEDVVDDTSSSEDVIVVEYTSTDDFTYTAELSEEERNAINAGADGKYLILINKTNKLPDDYVLDDLVDIRDTRKDRAPEKMLKVAETALHAMLQEAAANGYSDVTITSGYRTYAKQQALFNNYVNNEMAKGKDKESALAAAAKYSAYPGYSEHQTGLCADMHNLSGANQSFGYTDAGKWLAANAHRFGFILRYPQGKEDVTTYMWEPWHFRFVGIHHANEIYESGLCLEEYLAKSTPAQEVE